MTSKKIQGFTLIELMIVISILSILLAVSTPGFLLMRERISTGGQAKLLMSSINLARSEAIKRNATVTVCGSTTGTDCALNSWGNGWIVFVDNNADANGGAGSVDAGDPVLRVYSPNNISTTMTYPSPMLQYDSQGFGVGIPSTSRRFLICPVSKRAENADAIDISFSGRAARTRTGLVCP